LNKGGKKGIFEFILIISLYDILVDSPIFTPIFNWYKSDQHVHTAFGDHDEG